MLGSQNHGGKTRLHNNLFRDRSGWIVDGRSPTAADDLLAIGLTAGLAPWQDPALHLHQESEDYYLLLQGELDLWIAGNVSRPGRAGLEAR